ncbi:sister chromatid cohesion protein PDS5 homolog B-A-like [Styela clava]
MELSGIRFPPGSKSISADMNPSEILKSLKRCCKFFSQLEQDQDEEKKIYLPFCRYISESDLVHEITDANARIHLGCIFADIFRLHAPENPFPGDKLKDIFLFLNEQLSHLRDVKSTLFSKAYHILENVATVKSYNSCLELDNESADEVFCGLFKIFFSIVNSSHDDQLKAHMLDIMTCIVSESGSVSQRLFDNVFECLLEKTKKMNPSAYELARELLRKTAHNVEGVIMLFFQNILLGDHQDSNRLSRSWPQLITELYKIAPTLLVNTIPQIEMKLRTDNVPERLQVVRLLSRMFSEKDSSLSSQHTALWNSFLLRFNDIDPQIRAVCVNFCSDMVINHGTDDAKGREVLSKLVELLKLRRHDTEEGVRIAVVTTIRGIAMNDLRLVTDELLDFLRERLLDKKHKVRETAIRAVADIYKKFSASTKSPLIYQRKLGIFRSQLLRVYYTQNLDDCILLERILVSSLVQYSLPDEERMKQLFQLYCTADNHAVKALVEMFKKQKILKEALKDILNSLSLKDSEQRNKKLWPKILTLSSHLQSPMQAREHIKKFVAIVLDDAKIRQWLEYITAEQYTCQKVALAVRDILKKLDTDGVTKVVRGTVQQLLERVVLVTVLIDAPSMLTLTKLARDLLDGISDIENFESYSVKERGVDLLHVLAKHDPNLFADSECLEIFLSMLRGKDEFAVEKALLVLLNTCPIIEEKFTTIRTILLPELKAIAKTGTPKQAKYAVRCINLMTSVREAPLMQVFQQCKEMASEDTAHGLNLRTLLTTLGCIAECLPKQAGKELKGFIATVVVKKIIMKTKAKSSRKKKELKWLEKSEISDETATKLVAMKCMVRWLCGLNSNELDCCGSTLRLLQHMMHNDGDLMKCGQISKPDMAHLRLKAAFCVLRIARCDGYKDLISPSVFLELAILLMDDLREVRQQFLAKLHQALFKFQIHISFMSLFCVISQEKVKEHRDHGTALYIQLVKRYRDVSRRSSMTSNYMHYVMPEYVLSFTIHLLANDPDIPLKEEIPKPILSRLKESLNFMLEPLLTRDNPESFGFIKRLAELVKRTKFQDDSDNTFRNKTMYRVCDLVLQSVLIKSAQYAIGIVEPPDDAMKKFLPARLYTKLTSSENPTNYLPEAFQIEAKLVPTRKATSGESKSKSNAAKKSAKVPLKIVAVTKVAVTSPTKNRNAVQHSSSSTSKSLTTSSSDSQRRGSKRKVKHQDEDYLSSDEESLATKKTKLMQARKTPKKDQKSTKSKENQPIVEPSLEVSSPSQKTLSTPSEDSSMLSSPNSSVTDSPRPKRASAGSKMFDYLRSTKRTPTKVQKSSETKKLTVNGIADSKSKKNLVVVLSEETSDARRPSRNRKIK